MEPYRGYVLNARPDTVDFRDKIYLATLFEVPMRKDIKEYQSVGIPILDQGSEGACTGFGLATVIHFLLRTRKTHSFTDEISARMLYEMAKKYDEWEGEDYIGSSARGAMKGWHKHGVCLASKWAYDQHVPDKDLTAERAENAAGFPLGAYYRVNHKDIVDMHTALAEVGILYATARVHDGWFSITPEGEIPYMGQEIRGGHAFAIVAFDETGFWIQNSWGPTWGKDGFALITYDDWLANGTDVWVARLGAPITFRSSNSIAKSYSVAASARDGMSFKDLRPHVVSLGNDGKLKTTGTYGNYSRDIERIFTEYIPAITKGWKRKRIMLYAHGGLVDEASVLQRLADYRQTLLAKEIYPLFFVWNSDLWSTIKNLLQDALNQRKPAERVGSVFDFMLDRLDDALEPLVRFPGKLAWEEMKENAMAASDTGGGTLFTIQCLLRFIRDNPNTGIHLVGHSAGGIFLAPVVRLLTEQYGQSIDSCTLWAPACTMNDLDKYYLPAVANKAIDKFALFTLTEQAEQDDNCFHIYNKSLLYLVSHSFETIVRGTGILGMQKYIEKHRGLLELIGTGRIDLVTSPNNNPIPYACGARRHGDFDNDEQCFNSTVARILKSDPFLIYGDAAIPSDNMLVDGGEAGTRAGAVPSGGERTDKVPIGPSPVAPQVKMRPSRSDMASRRDYINRSLFL
ncbi:peptidase C1 [Pontibacter sp. XAAS-A31]|nr:peptidase C1 [Pontibacter harenae]